jgi:hypothetical protein
MRGAMPTRLLPYSSPPEATHALWEQVIDLDPLFDRSEADEEKEKGSGGKNPVAFLLFLFEASIVEHHVQNRGVQDYINSCKQNPIIQPNREGFILYKFSFKFFKSSLVP